MSAPRIGSLFSGYEGLGMAVEAFYGATTAWVSDVDKGACKILAHHWPDVPNIGDITTVDWSAVEPVDIITGGSPCPDLSYAGKRGGMTGNTRSNLWVSMREAIAALRPSTVVWENVRGAYSAGADSDLGPCEGCMDDPRQRGPVLRALGRVLGDLSSLGYNCQWRGLRAADVGAPHGRFRVFVLAADANHPANDREWSRPGSQFRSQASADADSLGRERVGGARGWRDGPADLSGGATPADTTGGGRDEGRPEPEGQLRRPDATVSRCWYCGEPAALGGDCDNCGAYVRAAADTDGSGTRRDTRSVQGEVEKVGWSRLDVLAALNGGATAANTKVPEWRAAQSEHLGSAAGPTAEPGERTGTDWGACEPAIRRWERVLGRVAPAPTETGPRGGQRLAPAFVEFMMGLPPGHVTAVPGLTRNEQLKALGNGVVPQQALAALRMMA